MDMQNDFARPDGTLTSAAAEAMIPRLAQLLDRARAQNVRVAYTQILATVPTASRRSPISIKP